MEIEVIKEDISQVDSGGGCRRAVSEITIDISLPHRQQRQAAIYETLSLMLDYVISHERLSEMTETLGEVLDQLGGE